MEPKTVKVGDADITIRPFKGLKALKAGEIISRITERVPEINEAISAYAAKARETNVMRLNRATAELRYPEEAKLISEQAWEQSGGVIELPSDPSAQELVTAIFPVIFTMARDEAINLLALVVAPDSELRTADEETGDIAEVIERHRRQLLYEGEVQELAELALVASEALKDQLSGKAEVIGELLTTILGPLGIDVEPMTPEQTAEPSPSSSTDSPEPTDGVEEKSSSESPGESSLTSTPA